MGTKCSGCTGDIYDVSFMECCKESCKKLYHCKCLSMSTELFENLTQAKKDGWICPDCVRLAPRGGDNSNTPIRNLGMNETYTPGRLDFVNKVRGGGGGGCGDGERTYMNESTVDTDKKVLEELREFRREIESRFDNQKNYYALLEKRFCETVTELRELKKSLRVFEKKADEVEILRAQNAELIKRNAQLEASSKMPPEPPRASFASVASINIPIREAKKKDAATKQAGVPQVILDSLEVNENESSTEFNIEKEKEHNWTVVKKKQRKFPNSEVKRGGNSSGGEIQGMEKQKFLHIWRVKKDVTIEKLQRHVQSILGDSVSIKIEAIKHKIARDYLSFIIGVPESKYDKLCNKNIWDVNIEYCEWIWFRSSTNKPQKG